LRGLEPGVNEELLARGVEKLYRANSSTSSHSSTNSKKPPPKVSSTTSDSNLGAKSGTLQRVMIVRDRKTSESWRYGFAEFATVEVILGHRIIND
jgi:hypothetical protein